MPGVTRVGDKCTGHDGYEPKPLIEGSKTFKVDGRSVGLVGCHYEEHSKPNADTHQDYIAEGAPSFFIEGKPVARIGDKVEKGGTVAEGSTTFIIGNKGGQDYGISIGYPIAHQLTKALYKLTPIDEVILELPAIAENEAKTACDNENDKLGWMELAQMFRFWLMDKAYIIGDDWKEGKAPIYKLRLNFDWFCGYVRFLNSYSNLVQNAFSLAGKTVLVNILKNTSVWNKGGTFDFSVTEPKDWVKYAFNFRTVSNLSWYVDGMVACLAAFTIKVLASGEVIKQESLNEIKVNKLYVYVQDLFNFEGEQEYRFWNREKLDFSYKDISTEEFKYYNLTNELVNLYRQKTQYGRDFLVLSNLFEVKEFNPYSFYWQREE